jgi:hypothetical protein
LQVARNPVRKATQAKDHRLSVEAPANLELVLVLTLPDLALANPDLALANPRPAFPSIRPSPT